MSSLLKSCLNCRAILPDNLKYLRSDVPNSITDDEIYWLRQNDIRYIIDLRTEAEQLRKPCPLQNAEGFFYHSMPVSGGNAVPASPDEVSASYLAMADEQLTRIIRSIETADCGVLYFCNAGKDRTGVVSAILLLRMGFDKEYIISDYLRSAENLKEMLENFAASNPDVRLDVITPQQRYMEEFLLKYQK